MIILGLILVLLAVAAGILLFEGTRAALVKPPRPELTSGDDVTTPAYAPRYRAGMNSDDDYRCFSVAAGPTGPMLLHAKVTRDEPSWWLEEAFRGH